MELKKFHRTIGFLLAIALCASMPAVAGGHKSTSNGSAKSKSHKLHLRKGAWKRHGQQQIDAGRAREIQATLIREKYLQGEPSGVWDQQTKQAMTRYQDDHGWQTKSLPDARALIQLGLGPKHENVLNPESLGMAPANPPQNSFAGDGRPLK